jgi:ribonuclease PH
VRPSGRKNNQLRKIILDTSFPSHAEGACFVSFGSTRVICTASVENFVPNFLKGTGKGWVTAEYGMLPRSTNSRMRRESAQGKLSGRTQEIQRLIARSLRAAVDLSVLGERQIIIDCDVIQADGGTRTASITGGYVALCQAIYKLIKERKLSKTPIIGQIAAISCGIYRGEVITDLDYIEDSNAEVDANFVMNNKGEIIEIQGTAEEKPFGQEQLSNMLKMANYSIDKIIEMQKEAINANC